MQMSELNQLGLPCGAGWWTMIYVWPTFFAGHNCNCFSSRWICLHWFYVVLIRPRIFQTVEHWVFQVEKLKQQNLSWQNLSWPLQRQRLPFLMAISVFATKTWRAQRQLSPESRPWEASWDAVLLLQILEPGPWGILYWFISKELGVLKFSFLATAPQIN